MQTANVIITALPVSNSIAIRLFDGKKKKNAEEKNMDNVKWLRLEPTKL